MLTLLVERRDEIRLGSLIPVGDLWDAIATGDQPFSEGMRIEFDNAKRLWTQKLLPALERTHGVSWQDLQDGRADPRAAENLRNDARLLKTLLLAALVPEVPALRALTAARLAALNHGSVVSPIPGRESQTVLTKLRGWAAQVGEIRLTDDVNPTISLQITGVDVEPILANASHYDNDGTRRSRIQKTLFDALGISTNGGLLAGQGVAEYSYVWRGTRRVVDICFEAISDLSDERLRGRAAAPLIVLGMPFDTRGRTPADHRSRLAAFNDDEGAEGVAWLPSHFGDRALKDLGTLVRIDYLLAGPDRLDEAARHLSVTDREQARAILRSQQSALNQRLRVCLEAAYGIRPDQDNCLGATVPAEERFVPLDRTFRPQTPAGANLKDALDGLLGRLFEHLYPAHPMFEQEVRPAALRRILDQIQRAAGEAQQRLSVPDHSVRRDLSALAGPLNIGTMGQTHFVLSTFWADHFSRMQAQAGGGAVTVARLRAWIDQPKPTGLSSELQNLIILAFVAQADRTLMRNGAPAPASLDRVDDSVELHEQPLPSEETWARARERASVLFGMVPSAVRKGATVSQLADALKERADATRPVLDRLAIELRTRMERFGVGVDTATRTVTLRSATAFVTELGVAADPLAIVNVLADAEFLTSDAAVGRGLGSAATLSGYIASVQWDVIEAAASLSDHRAVAAEAIRTDVARALEADEHVVGLQPVLQDTQTRAIRLLADTRRPLPPPPPDEVLIDERVSAPVAAAEAIPLIDGLQKRLSAEPGATLTIGWRLTRRTGAAAE